MSLGEERSQPIVETSLTELSFVFFFILLIFSALKFIDLQEKIDEKDSENNQLQELVTSLKDDQAELNEIKLALSEVIQDMNLPSETSTDDMFKELILQAKDQQELFQKAAEFDQLTKLIEDKKSEVNNESLSDQEFIKEMVQKQKDLTGQNKNLRGKIAEITKGNGLDHPPCWSDPETGKIQYTYNMVINENSVEVHPGWPDMRDEQAVNDEKITRALGEYTSNESMWSQTRPLYDYSVEQECRYYVRIFDYAESKDAFKGYLSGIESHFYKYLDDGQFKRQAITAD